VGGHLINGEFQSDKYPSTPRGKVPLSVKDKTAQDLLWAYAQRRRVVDAEFSDDLEIALLNAGYRPPAARPLPPPNDDNARGGRGNGGSGCLLAFIIVTFALAGLVLILHGGH